MNILKTLFLSTSKWLATKNLYITKSLAYKDKKWNQLDHTTDHIRYSVLQLCMSEIKQQNIEGNLAELGVYKGDFAKRINFLHPNKKLYLFDTFEGFDKRDTTKDVSQKYSTGEQDFSDTSVALVMGKMKTPENCIVRKGFFPETANGLEDIFSFVSIDTDLFEPIYAGLQYFYPRLSKGGYIFIHDFNNDEYKGTREAVLRFTKEQGISFVPLSDVCGTAIITK